MKKSFLKFGLIASLGASLVMGTSCKKNDECTDCGGENTPTLTTDTTVANGITTVTLTTANGAGTGTVTLEKAYQYVLNGKVYVNSGDVLTIDAGTIIKGGAGSGEAASALVVARGGKIMAEGTANEPIIFTSAADGIYRDSNGNIVEGNLDENNKGLWGGLVVLGNAGLTGNQVLAIEGLPVDDERSQYGNATPVNDENSGVLKYISIRHGGAQVAADNEINGLTLGGVGSGTTIDYVEVFANFDDGIEWFGGTVNVKHAVVAYCGDDSFDYDQGFRGNGQFWLTIGIGDRGGEHDGGPSDCEDCTPYAIPTIANVTYIGVGDNRAITFRDNAGGKYSNAIFVDMEKGIDIEDLQSGEDSRARLEAGDLTLDNITFENVTDNYVVSSEGDDLLSHKNVTKVTTNGATGITAANPVPASAVSGATIAADDFFDATDYQGAFGSTNWASGWSRTYQVK